MDNRVVSIDIAKGISIFFVVLFHSNMKLYFPALIDGLSLVRMPLFFFLSGVFFSCALHPKKFIFKKADALLKPYFVVLISLFLLNILLLDRSIPWHQLIGILYGNGDTIAWVPMWFLTHLFMVYVFGYILLRYFRFDRLPLWVRGGVLVMFISVGTLGIDYFRYADVEILWFLVAFPGLPFSMDLLLVTLFYFLLGYSLRRILLHFKPHWGLFAVMVLGYLLIVIFTHADINLNARVYSEPFFATLGALGGIYIIIALSSYLSAKQWLGSIFLRLGGGSLFVLIFHSYINARITLYFAQWVSDEAILMIIAFFALLMSLVIPLWIKSLVSRSELLARLLLPSKKKIIKAEPQLSH